MIKIFASVIALTAFLCACDVSKGTSNVTGERADIIIGKVGNYSNEDAIIKVMDFDENLRREVEVATGTIKSDGTLNIELPQNPTVTYELPTWIEGCNFNSAVKGRFSSARYLNIQGTADYLVEIGGSTVGYPQSQLQRIYADQNTEFAGECNNSSGKVSVDLKFKKGWNFVKIEKISENQYRQTTVISSAGFVWQVVYGP